MKPTTTATTEWDCCFPDFPHPHNDEPTPDWTVQELLQKIVMNAHTDLRADCDKECTELWQQYHDWERTTRQALQNQNDQENNSNNNNSNSNKRPTNKRDVLKETTTTTTTTTTTAAASKKNEKSTLDASVLVTVTTGPHAGETFSLMPTQRPTGCPVGRSRGKKFTQKGISLKQDLEVSTTHGHFVRQADNSVHFVDASSTNGTFVAVIEENGQSQQRRLEPNVPLQLHDKMELILGQSTFKIRLGSDS